MQTQEHLFPKRSTSRPLACILAYHRQKILTVSSHYLPAHTCTLDICLLTKYLFPSTSFSVDRLHSLSFKDVITLHCSLIFKHFPRRHCMAYDTVILQTNKGSKWAPAIGNYSYSHSGIVDKLLNNITCGNSSINLMVELEMSVKLVALPWKSVSQGSNLTEVGKCCFEIDAINL